MTDQSQTPRARFLRAEPPPLGWGIAVALLAVAAITGLIFPVRQISPPAAGGVLYLLAVLLVATVWGFWLGIATSFASAFAYNFFHLPPTGRLAIEEGRNWVALGVFFVAAVVASAVAELARSRAIEAEQRRGEADLAADLARLLLGGEDVAAALPDASERLARALGLSSAAIVLGEPHGDAGQTVFALHGGALVVPDRLSEAARRRLAERVVPSLDALLGAALERERLQAEVVEGRALRRSDELKTALLRTVSHDLRTPLTAILTAGEALSGRGLSDEDRVELGRVVSAEAQRLTALIDKLLDLSRLESGTADPHREWCSMEEILQEAAAALDPAGALFKLSLDRDLPLIRADAVQLDRAFANLLENAARYSGGEPVSVRARVVGDRLLVRVVDRGPGIAPRELERIFEVFYRSPGTRNGHTGSGLGLAIVKGFVEANGGEVWAESLPGQGTSFVVAFPVGAPSGGA